MEFHSTYSPLCQKQINETESSCEKSRYKYRLYKRIIKNLQQKYKRTKNNINQSKEIVFSKKSVFVIL